MWPLGVLEHEATWSCPAAGVAGGTLSTGLGSVARSWCAGQKSRLVAVVTSLWRITSGLNAGSRIERQCPDVLEKIFRTVMCSGLMVVATLKVTTSVV